MRKLHVRFYLAVLASLAVFALAAAGLWWTFADPVRNFDRVTTVIQNALPAADAPAAEQQAALERVVRGIEADLALFAADRSPLAAVGARIAPPDSSGWQRSIEGGPIWAVRLPDGRWLAARVPRERRGPGFGLLTLVLILAAVGIGTYPVARRLTRRIERLQAGVESLGAGEFSSRVQVEGRDEVAQLAASFNRAAARIEELVGAHRSLLANASHELRTPLARIRMAVELMKEAAEPARKRELEQDIAELDQLIDEILLASRLDAVSGLEREEDVDLLALAAEECARYPEAELDGQPASVRGDPRLLRRLIRNLVDNAKRHGAPPIELRVSRTAAGAEIRVCDHGPGVPEGEREKVFEPFHRFSGAREATGAGLGLSLVRQIAQRHGGEARCEGNCFVVRLEPAP